MFISEELKIKILKNYIGKNIKLKQYFSSEEQRILENANKIGKIVNLNTNSHGDNFKDTRWTIKLEDGTILSNVSGYNLDFIHKN